MVIAAVIGICVILLILAFVLPRMSWWPQKGVDRTLGAGQSAASNLPGKAGELAEKPFESSRKAANRSAEKGREGRANTPV